MAAVQGGTDALPLVVTGLVIINVLAAGIMAVRKRMSDVPAFLLAGLVGCGACGLILSNIGGH